jgi:hypothetical protein
MPSWPSLLCGDADTDAFSVASLSPAQTRSLPCPSSCLAGAAGPPDPPLPAFSRAGSPTAHRLSAAGARLGPDHGRRTVKKSSGGGHARSHTCQRPTPAPRYWRRVPVTGQLSYCPSPRHGPTGLLAPPSRADHSPVIPPNHSPGPTGQPLPFTGRPLPRYWRACWQVEDASRRQSQTAARSCNARTRCTSVAVDNMQVAKRASRFLSAHFASG